MCSGTTTRGPKPSDWNAGLQTLNVVGDAANDTITVSCGQDEYAKVNGQDSGPAPAPCDAVRVVAIYSYGGDDTIDTRDVAAGLGFTNIGGGSGRAVYAQLGGGDDELLGTGPTGAEVYGENGDDAVLGGAGRELLYGGRGEDALHGRDGIDHLEGDEGRDRLRGGDGPDLIQGREAADTLFGDLGSDRFYGEEGDDAIFGGDGKDQLFGGHDEDLANGGAQVDLCVAELTRHCER